MVRTRGLEPPQDCSHYHLKVARLPIPPRPHILKPNVRYSLMSFRTVRRATRLQLLFAAFHSDPPRPHILKPNVRYSLMSFRTVRRATRLQLLFAAFHSDPPRPHILKPNVRYSLMSFRTVRRATRLQLLIAAFHADPPRPRNCSNNLDILPVFQTKDKVMEPRKTLRV